MKLPPLACGESHLAFFWPFPFHLKLSGSRLSHRTKNLILVHVSFVAGGQGLVVGCCGECRRTCWGVRLAGSPEGWAPGRWERCYAQ